MFFFGVVSKIEYALNAKAVFTDAVRDSCSTRSWMVASISVSV